METRPTRHDRWRDPEHVGRWIARTDRAEADRQERFLLLCGLLPFDEQAPIRLLELGAGFGALSAVILEVFPRAKSLCLDLSPIMVAEGRARQARFGDRIQFAEWDLSRPGLPETATPPYDAVVVSQVVHLLERDAQRRLFREVLSWTAEAGCFLSLHVLRAESEQVLARWTRAEEVLSRKGEVAGHHGQIGQPPNVGTLEEIREWIAAAGFDDVRCYWQRLDRALIGAYRGKQK
jgi:tRNA (cmo5U34)-methyltransferase